MDGGGHITRRISYREATAEEAAIPVSDDRYAALVEMEEGEIPLGEDVE